jgi:hypothetical protein
VREHISPALIWATARSLVLFVGAISAFAEPPMAAAQTVTVYTPCPHPATTYLIMSGAIESLP